jgi:hypothetical protein
MTERQELIQALGKVTWLSDLAMMQHELIHALRWPGPVDDAKVAELDQKIADHWVNMPGGVL